MRIEYKMDTTNYFAFHRIHFAVSCATDENDNIIGSLVRATYKGRKYELFTPNKGVWFLSGHLVPTKLRVDAMRSAYDLLKSAV